MIKDDKIEKISKLYKDLKNLYNKKINIHKYLKKKRFINQEAIQISYDLQSGSYIKKLNRYKNIDKKVFQIFNNTLHKNFTNIKSVLDFGSGELTRFNYVIEFFNNKKNIQYFACDISLNRLHVGKNFFAKSFKKKAINLNLFVVDNFRLPLPDNSIDVVITCHAIEPNRLNKEKIIKELLRVSKKGLCLMEPHYEIASSDQKKRMNYHKYVKGIPKFLNKMKYDYKIITKNNHINPNNPSSIFVVKKNKPNNHSKIQFINPLNKKNLIKLKNFLYCTFSGRLFPVFDDITIFSNNSSLFLPKPSKIKKND